VILGETVTGIEADCASLALEPAPMTVTPIAVETAPPMEVIVKPPAASIVVPVQPVGGAHAGVTEISEGLPTVTCTVFLAAPPFP
jgi:hypothetical protein